MEEPTPRDLLESAVEAWNATTSFHFALQLENRAIALDETGMLTYNSAEGDVVAPDRMQAQTMVRTPVGNTPVAFIAIGDSRWLTNPLSRQWEAAPPGTGAEVSGLFDPQTGIGAMLVNMETVEQVGEETMDGVPVVRLTGSLPGSVLSGFAADLSAVDQLSVEIFIGRDDNRIRRIIVREPAAAQTPTPTWTFTFSNFDQPVSIEPPL